MFWRGVLLTSLILLMGVAAQSPDEGYSREQLQPLTKFRCTREACHMKAWTRALCCLTLGSSTEGLSSHAQACLCLGISLCECLVA